VKRRPQVSLHPLSPEEALRDLLSIAQAGAADVRAKAAQPAKKKSLPTGSPRQKEEEAPVVESMGLSWIQFPIDRGADSANDGQRRRHEVTTPAFARRDAHKPARQIGGRSAMGASPSGWRLRVAGERPP
jgi:hypothetical protein